MMRPVTIRRCLQISVRASSACANQSFASFSRRPGERPVMQSWVGIDAGRADGSQRAMFPTRSDGGGRVLTPTSCSGMAEAVRSDATHGI